MNSNKFSFVTICVGSILVLATCTKEEIPIPECVRNTFPLNRGFVPGGQTIMLRWDSSMNAASFDVFFGEGAAEPALIAEGIKQTELAINIDVGNTSYSWYVLPRNAAGQRAECNGLKTTFETKQLPAFDTKKIPVNVLVISFDPIVGEGGTTKLHDVYGWADPQLLAEEFIQDIQTASHGLIDYKIVEWKEVNDFPEKVGGFKYNFGTYAACLGNTSTCRTPDDLDYRKMFIDFDVLTGINNDTYDEVWIFGGPYFGFWESAMAGNGAFYINGGVFPDVPSKSFAIMGFNYERSVGEMLHNLSHRTEASMSKVYGGWKAEELTTSWARFAANETQSRIAAVGSCHYPPNAKEDYDYCNEKLVMSSAEDWYNYPYLTGAMTPVNTYTWGVGDCQREYLRWWFNHLPYREGIAPDGFLNCWWRYIYELP